MRNPMKSINRVVMKSICRALLTAAAIGSSASLAYGQAWPSKPLRVIVPVAAGSTLDIIPRLVFEQLSPQLGQTIVVENRVGAGGTVGAAAVAKADPDGYTILANGSGHTIAPALYPNLSYRPAQDFSAVVPFGISPFVLVVASASSFKTAGDLVAAAKSKPGTLNFSSLGVGTGTHLSAERFRASAGIEAVHVPFKGGAEAMMEVIAGRIDFFFGPVGLVLPHIKDGKLKPLAVNGTQRSAALPDVPTTSESGFANAEYPIWFGLFLPTKTPREVVDTLHRETVKALQVPKVKEKLGALGVDPMEMTPAQFDAHIQKQIVADAALVKAIGLQQQ